MPRAYSAEGLGPGILPNCKLDLWAECDPIQDHSATITQQCGLTTNTSVSSGLNCSLFSRIKSQQLHVVSHREHIGPRNATLLLAWYLSTGG